MDWLIRIGAIIVWVCLGVDVVLLIKQFKFYKNAEKAYDEAIECLRMARTTMDIANRIKREYEEKFGIIDPLTSEEN